MQAIATIANVQLTPTHDGEAALVVEVTYPNGGRTQVQIESCDVPAVMSNAGARSLEDLIGHPWTVLQIRTVGAAAWRDSRA